MKVEDFVSVLDRVKTPHGLWRLGARYFSGTCVNRASYHHLPPPGAPDAGETRITAQGYPEEWVRKYVSERLYRVDPVALFSQRSVEPFFWSDITRLKSVSPEEQRYLAMLERADFGDGLAMQVFGPNGRAGHVCLGISTDAADLPAPRIREFQWVCQLAHLKYCTMIEPELGVRPSLTSRETEILTWVSRGKSNAVIAEILGLSPHTVDAHVRRVYLKLGVTDRISAALRGLGIGLIHGSA